MSSPPAPTDGRGEAAPALLQTRGLCKSFAAPVLSNLDFSVNAGEIHALMGSNGAGKSTLCNLVAGIHTPTAGELLLEGRPYAPSSLRAAEAAGVHMVMQELNLFPTLSVAENLCLKTLGGRLGLIDRRSLHARAQAMMAELELEDIDPGLPVAELGVGQQQLLEIARVLSRPLRLLILDEPTAALTDPQIRVLFRRLDRLREQGVGIIYISHRMDEICRIADRVSILRDGRLVATDHAHAMDRDRIVALMVGEAVEREILEKRRVTPGREMLRVEKLCSRNRVHDVSFSVHAGEVLGIGGLIGSGRTELLRAIFGADRADAGGIRLASEQFRTLHRPATPTAAVALGIGLVVEDRKQQGLLLPLSVASNISLASMQRFARRLGLIDRRQEASEALEAAAELDTRTRGPDQPVAELSGGNQQKVLVARWLQKDPEVLMFDEPGRGVDAAAKSIIHARIRAAAAAGKAVIVVSSETEELLALADRLLILSAGRVAGEFDPFDVSEEALMAASFRFYASRHDPEREDGSAAA